MISLDKVVSKRTKQALVDKRKLQALEDGNVGSCHGHRQAGAEEESATCRALVSVTLHPAPPCPLILALALAAQIRPYRPGAHGEGCRGKAEMSSKQIFRKQDGVLPSVPPLQDISLELVI